MIEVIISFLCRYLDLILQEHHNDFLQKGCTVASWVCVLRVESNQLSQLFEAFSIIDISGFKVLIDLSKVRSANLRFLFLRPQLRLILQIMRVREGGSQRLGLSLIVFLGFKVLICRLYLFLPL